MVFTGSHTGQKSNRHERYKALKPKGSTHGYMYQGVATK